MIPALIGVSCSDFFDAAAPEPPGEITGAAMFATKWTSMLPHNGVPNEEPWMSS